MKIKTYTVRGLLCCILLCLFTYTHAQAPWIDVNPGAGSSNPAELLYSNGNLYFVADDGSLGIEPYVIDCSGIDTDPSDNVTDIVAGSSGSSTSFFTEWNNGVYFLAWNGSFTSPSLQIFNYDASGTTTGMQFNNTSLGGFGASDLTAIGNYLFFVNMTNLQRMDLMGNIVAITGPGMTSIGGVSIAPTFFNGDVFFQGQDASSNNVLMQMTDPNVPTAMELVDNLGESIGAPQSFTVSGGLLYFIGNSPTSGSNVLYCYDGTNPPFVPMLSGSPITPVVGELNDVNGVLHVFTAGGDVYSINSGVVMQFSVSTTNMSCDGSSSMNTPSNIFTIRDLNGTPVIITTTGIYTINASDEIEVLQDGLTGVDGNAIVSGDGSTLYFAANPSGGSSPVLWSWSPMGGACPAPVMQDGSVTTPRDLVAIPNSDQIFFVGTSSVSGSEVFKSTPSVILSVEFLEFVAKQQTEQVDLKWLTASEIDNAGFEVERSKDANTWEALGFVKGNGTTTEISSYDFIDDAPLAGLNYYRLKQFDYDGTTTYSEIESIFFTNKLVNIESWPNPVREVLSYRINAEADDLYEAKLYDLMGQQVRAQQVEAEQTQQLDIAHLPAGNYYLKVNAGTTQFVQHIVKR